MGTALINDINARSLFFIQEFGTLKNLRVSHDAIKGSPQLVAHVSKEFTFCPTCCFCSFPGFCLYDFCLFAIVDIGTSANPLPDAAIFIQKWYPSTLKITIVSIRSAELIFYLKQGFCLHCFHPDLIGSFPMVGVNCI